LSKFTLTSCLGLLLVLHSYAVFGQKTNNFCPSGTATEDDRFRDIRSLIHQQMTKCELPSVAVSIAQHGHIVWEQGFGYADKENLLLATPDTMYRVASITKPFTATGLMRLVERGNIDLDLWVYSTAPKQGIGGLYSLNE
jgi:CubicO group peptidase (beta-lactamase class C family)